MNTTVQASEPDDSFSTNLVNISQGKVNSFRAGQIANYYNQWKLLTSNPEILDIVRGAHIDFQQLPVQKSPPKSNNFSDCESKLIDIEINKLLSKGVITPCRSEKHEFISRIFLRPKKDGTSRLILNLKSFNKNVEYHHFKMDTLHSILKLVRKNCWMASVDLKDAYYSCPVALRNQKYLKFSWKSQLYKYCMYVFQMV